MLEGKSFNAKPSLPDHFACISISAPTNISIIPVMALFITIRMLYGNGKVRTTPEKCNSLLEQELRLQQSIRKL